MQNYTKHECNMLRRNHRESKCLTAGVAVEGKVVHGTRRNARDLVLQRQCLDAAGKDGRGLLALEAKEVCGETSNVRGSHGGTRDGVLPLVSL
jgi:hypothetical protein